jgi:hypothetical protein
MQNLCITAAITHFYIWKSSLVSGRDSPITSTRSSQLLLPEVTHVFLRKRQIILLLLTSVPSQVSSVTLKLEGLLLFETSNCVTNSGTWTATVYSFISLSHDRSKAPSKASSPHGAI